MFTIPIISKEWKVLLANFRNRGFSGKDVRFGIREEGVGLIVNFCIKLFQEIKASNERLGIRNPYLVKLFGKKAEVWKKINDDRCEFIAKDFSDLHAFQFAIAITLTNYDSGKINYMKGLGKITEEIKAFLLNEIKKSPGEISLHDLIDIFAAKFEKIAQEEHVKPEKNDKEQEKSARIFKQRKVISELAREVLEGFFSEDEVRQIKIGAYYKKGLFYLNVSFSRVRRSIKKKQLPICFDFCSENTKGLIQGLQDLLSGWKERNA